MAAKYLIPRANAPFVDGTGHPTREWYNWLRALDVVQTESDADVQAEIAAIARALGSPDGSVANIPPQENAEVGKVVGINSVSTYGVLPSVVQVQLWGDVDEAKPTQFYGSDSAGKKGWHPMRGAFSTTTLDLASDSGTGVVSFDLADLADSNTGALLAIARDTKGRVSGTRPVTQADLPTLTVTALTDLTYPRVVSLDGAGNAYYPDLTSPADVSRIVGVTAHAAAAGAPVQIVTSRDFTEPAWSWLPGRIYCALTGGALTQSAPATGAIVEVARVVSPTTIRVGIQPATLR